MMPAALTLLATALLSSLCTWGLAWLWYQWRLRDALDARLTAVQDEFERRVHSGVVSAGTELLPQLREQVRKGFQDALKNSEAAGMVENAASAVNFGTDIVTNSLSALLGVRRK